jgi:hypothetical protein
MNDLAENVRTRLVLADVKLSFSHLDTLSPPQASLPTPPPTPPVPIPHHMSSLRPLNNCLKDSVITDLCNIFHLNSSYEQMDHDYIGQSNLLNAAAHTSQQHDNNLVIDNNVGDDDDDDDVNDDDVYGEVDDDDVYGVVDDDDDDDDDVNDDDVYGEVDDDDEYDDIEVMTNDDDNDEDYSHDYDNYDDHFDDDDDFDDDFNDFNFHCENSLLKYFDPIEPDSRNEDMALLPMQDDNIRLYNNIDGKKNRTCFISLAQ